ncbi:hypothetical protein [Cupriavidus basilensis]
MAYLDMGRAGQACRLQSPLYGERQIFSPLKNKTGYANRVARFGILVPAAGLEPAT